jgi:hypothetical protein
MQKDSYSGPLLQGQLEAGLLCLGIAEIFFLIRWLDIVQVLRNLLNDFPRIIDTPIADYYEVKPVLT